MSAETQCQLEDMKVIAAGLAQNVSPEFGQKMDDFNLRLENAAVLFSEIAGATMTDLEMPYTEEEENWIQIQLEKVEEGIRYTDKNFQ